MATGSSYLGYVRDVLGSVTRYWEAREDGDGFNKSWEVHEEVCGIYKQSSRVTDVVPLPLTFVSTQPMRLTDSLRLVALEASFLPIYQPLLTTEPMNRLFSDRPRKSLRAQLRSSLVLPMMCRR